MELYSYSEAITVDIGTLIWGVRMKGSRHSRAKIMSKHVTLTNKTSGQDKNR